LFIRINPGKAKKLSVQSRALRGILFEAESPARFCLTAPRQAGNRRPGYAENVIVNGRLDRMADAMRAR
jgi:hypothetical protein